MRALNHQHHMRFQFQAVAIELALAALEIVCGQINLFATEYATQRFVEIWQINGVDRFKIVVSIGFARCMCAVNEIVIERYCVWSKTACKQLYSKAFAECSLAR